MVFRLNSWVNNKWASFIKKIIIKCFRQQRIIKMFTIFFNQHILGTSFFLCNMNIFLLLTRWLRCFFLFNMIIFNFQTIVVFENIDFFPIISHVLYIKHSIKSTKKFNSVYLNSTPLWVVFLFYCWPLVSCSNHIFVSCNLILKV